MFQCCQMTAYLLFFWVLLIIIPLRYVLPLLLSYVLLRALSMCGVGSLCKRETFVGLLAPLFKAFHGNTTSVSLQRTQQESVPVHSEEKTTQGQPEPKGAAQSVGPVGPKEANDSSLSQARTQASSDVVQRGLDRAQILRRRATLSTEPLE